MISRVVEYSCQYSEQVRKKHKAWQDGKLKFYEANNRFLLYNEDSNTMLYSTFITNSKIVAAILNPQGFGTSEHKIFGRAVVIITDVLREYKKEVRSQLAGGSLKTDVIDKILNVEYSNYSAEAMPSSQRTVTTGVPPRSTHICLKTALIKNDEDPSSLVLKSNKPFKAPRRINENPPIHKKSARPAVRTAHIKHEIPQLSKTNHVKAKETTCEESSEPSNKRPSSEDTTIQSGKTHSNSKRSKSTKHEYRSRIRLVTNLRIKHIDHSPIII